MKKYWWTLYDPESQDHGKVMSLSAEEQMEVREQVAASGEDIVRLWCEDKAKWTQVWVQQHCEITPG